MSAMPAEIMPTEPEPTSAGPVPVRAAPAPVRPAPRRSSSRPRPAGARPRPVGVRACSAVLRAEPAVAAPISPAPLMAPLMPARTAPHPRPHLTGRGRSALVAGVVIVATLLWFAVASAVQGPARAMPPRATGHTLISQVVVQRGQTLWSIALQADPSADPRLVVQQIVSMNSLTGQNIVAGQRLRVPQG